jgi:diacylglycerol kinase (ATP)
MAIKNIHIIINPAAGEDEPILSYLNKAFLDSGIKWEVSVTRKDYSAKEIAKSLIGKTDLIAVYGGDGSVMEAAQALIGTDMPLAIIPGGTANVMAKELGIPTDVMEALALIRNNELAVRKIDTGLVNGEPFMLRVNFGIMADMVTHADREMKENFGQLAYGFSTLQTLIDVHPTLYKMKIDGKAIEEEGVSLTITNSGNIGLEGYSFLPGISVSDGFFDVILLNHADLSSILRVTGSTLFHTDSDVLKRWKCKEVTIELDHAQKFICDDIEKEASCIHINVVAKSLNILVPVQKH